MKLRRVLGLAIVATASLWAMPKYVSAAEDVVSHDCDDSTLHFAVQIANSTDDSNNGRATRTIQRLALAGHAPSQLTLSHSYRTYRKEAAGQTEARRFLEAASKSGYAPAANELGELYYYATDSSVQQRRTGLALIMQAAQAGYGLAQLRLYNLYRADGDLPPTDPAVAEQWLNRYWANPQLTPIHVQHWNVDLGCPGVIELQQSLPNPPRLFPVEADELAVYAAALDSEAERYRGKRWLIHAGTKLNPSGRLETVSRQADVIMIFGHEISTSVVDQFHERNRLEYRIGAPILPAKVEAEMTTVEDFSSFGRYVYPPAREKPNLGSFVTHVRRYSRVGFNADRTIAIVTWRDAGAPALGGGGELALFVKVNGAWQLAGKRQSWFE